ncbi:MAG: ATP-binding cassette domain-containing protein [Deltaproteobacteria bacterium]|nr:ATP-binding cassette domain-containing protein [Deltaproteobacteria bacterium]
MIHVQNVSKQYGDLLAVDNISFQLNKGDVLGFLGPNGAGKTTTMRIITGYMPATKGKVYIADVDIFEDPLIAKSHIGYLPENPPLYEDMIVRDYLDFVAEIKQVPDREKNGRINYIMDKCGILDVGKRIIGHLSKGYRQRIGIAQALINDPAVLVLDEPTNGLDPKQIIEIRELIKGLSGDRTVILSTHILPEVTMICSKVVIINKGKIALEESLERLTSKMDGVENILLKTRYWGEEIQQKIISLPNVSDIRLGISNELIIQPKKGTDIREELSDLIMRNGWGLLEMRPVAHNLEEVFLRVISSEGD